MDDFIRNAITPPGRREIFLLPFDVMGRDRAARDYAREAILQRFIARHRGDSSVRFQLMEQPDGPNTDRWVRVDETMDVNGLSALNRTLMGDPQSVLNGHCRLVDYA